MKHFMVVAVCLAGLSVLMTIGCVTTAKGPTDEEQISQRMQDCIAGIKAKNYNAFVSFVSASFHSSAVGDRNALLDFLKNADSAGFLDGIEIEVSGAKTTVTGEKATLGPVVATGSFGALTLNFGGAKENGVWMITGLEPGY